MTPIVRISEGADPGEPLFDRDELARYIIRNHSDLMTDQERLAYRSILGEVKAQNSDSPTMQVLLRRHWVSDDPQVLELLRDGSRAFFLNTRDRILKDRADDLMLNYCPRCGALARTPRAKQCPKCFHSWHDAVNNAT